MADGIRKGFFTTSSKEEKKQDTKSSSITSSLTNQSSQCTQPQQQPNPTQTGKRMKQAPKTPTTEEKPRKRQEIVMHKEVREFDFGQQHVDVAQLALMVVDLQEEVKKLKRMNEKLLEKLEEKDQQDESRIDNYERQMDALFNIQNEQNRCTSQLSERVSKQGEELQQIKKPIEQIDTGAIPMVIEEKQKEPRLRITKPRKQCYYCKSFCHLIRNCKKFKM